MGDPNGCLDSPLSMPLTDSISPPSLKDPRYERNDVYRMESPLLDTELLPNDDHQACPYCHRGFRKPRVLDCLHSMCEDCIIAQLDGRREAQKAHELMNTRDSTDFELEAPKVNTRPTPPGVIRCPICAQETHVGNDVRFVHGLLLDYVKLNENDDTRSTQVPPAQVERRCRACKSEQAAIAFCKQCQSDLCSNCLTAHGLMRMFDGHNPVHYAELSGGSGDRCETRAVVCPHHHQPYKVLCATCEHLACKTCLEMEHLHHKVIEVNDRVVTAIEAEIRGLVNNVDHQWRNSMAEWSSIPDRSASLHDQYETAKARLENNFELISQLLEESRQRKIKELEETRIKQEHAIEELYRKMNLNESRVSDALSFTRQLLEKANGMELIASRKKVVQQLNNLAHTMPALGIQIELEYQPMTKKQAEQQLAAICGSVSARMCSTMKESLSMDQIRGTPSTDQSATSSGGAGPIASSGSSEWPRLNGNTASAPNLPAIGTERKKGAGSGITTRGSTDSFGGWPPSSNPPDLPSISPPLQQQNKDMNLPTPLGPGPQGIHSAIYSNYAWPPSSNPSLQQNPQAQALLRQQLAMAALLQNNAAMNGHNSAAAAANALLVQQQARIRAAQVLQQQQQQQQNDPLLASISGLSLSGTSGFDAPGQRTSPQEQQQGRLNELKIHSVFGTSQSGSTIRELHCPSGFCLSESDDILIADTNNHRVTVCGPPAPWKIGKTGTEDGMLCFPRKVVALKGSPIVRYLIFDKGADGKTRAQIFNNRGEFEKKVQIAHGVIPRGGVEVTAATCTTEGYLLFVDATCGVFCLDVDKERVLSWFDASKQLGEASDVAYYEEKVYITDFKNHCVQVFALNGEFIRKLGEPSQTPYPIGIDISKNGDILVADTHGNHLHVVVFSSDGSLIQSFTHNEFRLSRCVGLRVAGSGHIVTLCKHNHTLFVFKPLFIR